MVPLGSFSSLIWDPNLSRNQNCPFLTIQDLTDKAKNNLIKKDTVISSSGFIASPPRYDNHCIKYLLYNGYDDTLKHGMYPALMLHFCEDSWKHAVISWCFWWPFTNLLTGLVKDHWSCNFDHAHYLTTHYNFKKTPGLCVTVIAKMFRTISKANAM